MKINQLPQGARFEYEGKEYVKTGPMIASGDGGQRLIPKYAVLKPLGEFENAGASVRKESLSKPLVLDAFNAFYAKCEMLMPDDGKFELSAARSRFLQALD